MFSEAIGGSCEDLLAPACFFPVLSPEMANKDCMNCQKFQSYIATFEAHLAIMRSSFYLVSGMLEEVKASTCSQQTLKRNPAATTTAVTTAPAVTRSQKLKRKNETPQRAVDTKKSKSSVQVAEDIADVVSPSEIINIDTVPDIVIAANDNELGVEGDPVVPINLTVAEPIKCVFVTGFGVDTTAVSLKAYIAERVDLKNVAGFHVHQLKIDSSRGYSSFKVFAGRNVELFQALMDSRFWPEEIIFHEHFRRNPRRFSNIG